VLGRTCRSLSSPAMAMAACAAPSVALSARRNVAGRSLTAAAAPAPARALRTPLHCVAAADVAVKSADGSDKGTVSLDLKTAGANSMGLVHKYLVITQQNKGRGTASTLTRSEVRGGGRKPFKQKGTGNARAGTRNTPLKPGGGVVFGPKPKDWTVDMNKKERRLAMGSALQSAASSMVVVSDLASQFSAPKTASMYKALASVGVTAKEDNALMIVSELTENMKLSGRNVPGLKVATLENVSVYDVLRADKLVVEEAALAAINAAYA
jgi:large subunit ribosomal protein L4